MENKSLSKFSFFLDQGNIFDPNQDILLQPGQIVNTQEVVNFGEYFTYYQKTVAKESLIQKIKQDDT